MSETVSIEFKRKWWDFRQQNEEFARDVAALANANTKDEKMIVVGLAENGRIHDAPPPEDESQLQNRLSDKVTPLPNVRLETAQVEGSTLSVLRVLPPFDKPYVTLFNNKNIIFVRRGSRVSTVTRAMLDKWYTSGANPVDVELVVGGNSKLDGATIEYVRPRHEAGEPRAFHFPSHNLWTDPGVEARRRNSLIEFEAALANNGVASARDLLVDLLFRDVAEVWIVPRTLGLALPRPSPWQLDPARNCYVDGRSSIDGGVVVRERVRVINPTTVETLIPVQLRCRVDGEGVPLPVKCDFTVSTPTGIGCRGTVTLTPRFSDEVVVVEPRSRI